MCVARILASTSGIAALYSSVFVMLGYCFVLIISGSTPTLADKRYAPIVGEKKCCPAAARVAILHRDRESVENWRGAREPAHDLTRMMRSMLDFTLHTWSRHRSLSSPSMIRKRHSLIGEKNTATHAPVFTAWYIPKSYSRLGVGGERRGRSTVDNRQHRHC